MTSAQPSRLGEVELPEFELGPYVGDNIVVVQGDGVELVTTIRGTYANAWLEALRADPFQTVCRGTATMAFEVIDVSYKAPWGAAFLPTALVQGAPVAVEIVEGGGWLDVGGRLVRAAIFHSDERSRVEVAIRAGGRTETLKLRAYFMEAPENKSEDVALALTGPWLITGSPFQPTYSVDISPATVPEFRIYYAGAQRWDLDVLVTPTAPMPIVLHPETPRVVGGAVALDFGRMLIPGPLASVRLTDYPDAPATSLGSVAAPAMATTLGDAGVVITTTGDTVQYLGAKASARPITLHVAMQPPVVSYYNDPAAPGHQVDRVLLLISASHGDIVVTGAAKVGAYHELPFTPGQSRDVSIVYTTDDDNLDGRVDVTVEVRLRDGTTVRASATPADTPLEARFFRARLAFSRHPDFKPIEEVAIRPCPVVDASGQLVAPPDDAKIYVELRSHDIGDRVGVTIYGGVDPCTGQHDDARPHAIVLAKVASTSAYTLYRSEPFVCHLDAPEAFGVDTFAATGYTPVFVGPPYAVAARLDPMAFGIATTNEYSTAVRPAAFLAFERATDGARHGATWFPVLPTPEVDLDLLDASKLVIANQQVAVSIKGIVRDVAADQFEKKPAPSPASAPVKVVVGGKSVDVTNQTETATRLRPYAWRGDFSTTVELRPGVNVVDVTATNVLGGSTTRRVIIDLLDERNDYANPDVAFMSARVRVVADPRSVRPELGVLHYHSPAQPAATTTTTAASLSVTLTATDGGATSLDQATIPLAKDRTTNEQIWSSAPIIVVPSTTDVTAARALGIGVIRYEAGLRLDALGTGLAHAGGALALHAVAASLGLEVRFVKLLDDNTTWVVTDSVARGDRFTIEVKPRGPRVLPDLALTLVACDPQGRRLPGEGHARHIYVAAGPLPAVGGGTGTWLRMQAYLDDRDPLLAVRGADHLVATGRDELVTGHATLRVADAASIRIAQGGHPEYQTLVATDGTYVDAYVSAWFSVLQPDGSFARAERIQHGDTFRVEATALAYPRVVVSPSGTLVAAPPVAFRAIELSIATTPHFATRSSAADRVRRVRLLPVPGSPAGAAPLYRLSAHLDASLQWVDTTQLIAVDDRGGSSTGSVALHVFDGGKLVIGERIPGAAALASEIDPLPRRQVVAGAAVSQVSPRGTSAMFGAGDSVVVSTGEMTWAEVDAALAGEEIACAIQRTYTGFSDHDGPLGHGWNHTFHRMLYRDPSGDYRYLAEDGTVHRFTRQATGYEAPPGIYAQLEERSQIDCRLAWPHGRVEIYLATGASHRRLELAAVIDRSDQRLELLRDQDGVLLQVIDPLGQRLFLRSDPRLRVAAIGDATGRSWEYRYHDGKDARGAAGDLASVRSPVIQFGISKFPQGKIRSYRYHVDAFDGPLRHKLEAVQDGRGNAESLPEILTISYTPEGRVDYQIYDDDPDRRAANQLGRFRFTYDAAASKTTTWDRRGNERQYELAGTLAQQTVVLLPDPAGGAAKRLVTKHQYNTQTELIRVELPLGGVTEMTFKHDATDPRERGQITSAKHLPAPSRSRVILDAHGAADPDIDPHEIEPTEIEWKWTYEASDQPGRPRMQRVATITDPLGRMTTFVYDYDDPTQTRQVGDLVRVEHPPVTIVGGTQSIITRYRSNNFGQHIATIDPCGVETRYEYYKRDRPNGTGRTITAVAAPSERTGRLARVTQDAPTTAARSASLTPAESIATERGYDVWGFPSWLREGVRPAGYTGTDTPAMTETVCNEVGQVIEHQDAEGHQEELAYDANDRCVRRQEYVIDCRFPADVDPADTYGYTVIHELEYDRLGRLTAHVIDKNGLDLRHAYKYDPSGNLEREDTPAAKRALSPEVKRFKKCVYDARDLLLQAIQAPDAAQPLSRTFVYDDDGQLERITDAQGVFRRRVYDAWGHLVAEVDALGNAQRTTCDALGRTVREQVTEAYQDEATPGRVLSESLTYRDEVGREVARVQKVFRHDATTGASITIDLGRRTTSYGHDANGNVVSVQGPALGALPTTTKYDGRGHPVELADPYTGVTRYTYDKTGNVTSVTFPRPVSAGSGTLTLRRTYDHLGRMLTAEVASGGAVSYFYDSLGQRRIAVDPLGNRTFSHHDHAGRQVRMVRAIKRDVAPSVWTNYPYLKGADIITEWKYDENDNLLQITGDQGAPVALTHAYGDRDEHVRTTFPSDAFAWRPDPGAGPRTFTFDYWPNGLLRTVTNPDGMAVVHRYDGAARLSEREATAGTSPAVATKQVFTYDGAGRMTRGTDDNGQGVVEVKLTYDSLGNVWSDEQTFAGDPRTFAATYNDRGALDYLVYPGGKPGMHYFRDDSGRVIDVWEREDAKTTLVGGAPDGQAIHLASYHFDAGFLAQRDCPKNGTTLTITHGAQCLVGERSHHPTADPLAIIQGEAFEWLSTGAPRRIVDTRTNIERAIWYDSAGRVTDVHDGKPAGSTTARPQTAANTRYDARGNVWRLLFGAVSAHDAATGIVTVGAPTAISSGLNDADQLGQTTEIPPAGAHVTRDYFYDLRGNVREDPDYTYRYDALNRLAIVHRKNPAMDIEFRYDVLGRLIRRGSSRYAYYGDQLLEEDDSSLTGRRYLRSGTDVLALELKGSPLLRWYTHEDRAGSILTITGDDGKAFGRYTYDQFGVQHVFRADGTEVLPPGPTPSTTGGIATIPAVIPTGPSPFANHLMHHGQLYDPDTRLYLLGSRAYNPRIQRFLQRDPLHDYASTPYAYAGNNTFALTDPTGNVVWYLPILVIVGAAVVAEGVTAIWGPEAGSIAAGFSPIHSAFELYYGYRIASVFSSYRGAELSTADYVMNGINVATAGLSVAGTVPLRGAAGASRWLRNVGGVSFVRGARAASGVLSTIQLGYSAANAFQHGDYGWALLNLALLGIPIAIPKRSPGVRTRYTFGFAKGGNSAPTGWGRHILRTIWQDTKNYTNIGEAFEARWGWLVNRVFPTAGKGAHGWSLYHVFVQHHWYGKHPLFPNSPRLTRLLQAIGDSGINLLPFPEFRGFVGPGGLNSWLYRHTAASVAFAAGTVGVGVAMPVGAYFATSWAVEKYKR